MKTLVLALATTAITATTAAAAGLSSVDLNGDNFASKAEVTAQYPTLSANDFRTIDQNRDGRLSNVEFNNGATQAVLKQHVSVIGSVQGVSAIDTDGSGFVSEAELAAAYPGISAIDFDRIDANRDNRVSFVELYSDETQSIVSRHDVAQPSVLVALDVIDTDNSGFASIGELTAKYKNISEVDFDLIDTNNDNRVSFDELYDAEAVTILAKNL